MAIADSLRWTGAPERARIGAGAVLVLGAELVLGATVATGYRQLALLAVFGAVGAYVVVRAPFAASVALLVIVASVLSGSSPRISVAGREILPYEPLLVLLLGVAALRPQRRSWGGGVGLALALFLGMLALSSALAVRVRGADLNTVMLWGRGYVVLAFFWVVVRLFPSRRDLMRLLAAAALIGGLTGVVSLIFSLGVSPDLLIPDAGENLISHEGAGSLLRVRLPGLALAFMLLPLMLYLVASGHRPRLLWGAALTGSLLAVLVSFNRNMWVAGLLGTSLLLALVGPQARGRVLASIATLLAALALLLALPPTSESVSHALTPLVKRGSTLLNPSKVEGEDSLQDRSRETRVAWETAQRHLGFGIAPGVSWGSYSTDLSSGVAVRTPQLFLHNQYLYLLVITGVPGLICFVAYLLGAASSGLSRSRRRPVLATLGVAMVMLMLTAAVMLSLSDTSYLVAIALVTGAIVALRAEDVV